MVARRERIDDVDAVVIASADAAKIGRSDVEPTSLAIHCDSDVSLIDFHALPDPPCSDHRACIGYSWRATENYVYAEATLIL